MTEERVYRRWYLLPAAALAQAVLVAASTLTIKQHVLADAASGILLAELMWQVSGRLIRQN